jgi:epsilon-lactone hydrolase
MSKIRFAGPLSMRLSSFLALNRIAIRTYLAHAFGHRMGSGWDASFETSIRFWRHQFTRAMTTRDLAKGRQILDSLQTETDETYAVTTEDCVTPKGRWYLPVARQSRATILYLHGGGYTFHGAMSVRFAAMLAHHMGAPLFAPNYRLTPEHPHPAQAEDALAAWHHVTGDTPAKRVVVIGDSAGGHMALGLLQTLKCKGLVQPALCIGLCPWTDIGARGESLHGNDRYDLVQGWMALQFGAWLDPEGRFGRAALSPISFDFRGLAPIYLQAGGREVLCDMIRDFAHRQAENRADVLLDIWEDMPHDFQAFDSLKRSSGEALNRIRAAVLAQVEGGAPLVPGPKTVVSFGQVFGAKSN